MTAIFTTFLLPLVAGFLILSRIPYLSHISGRTDNYRLLIMSISAGMVLQFFAYLLVPPARALVNLLDSAGLEVLAHLLRMTWRFIAGFVQNPEVSQSVLLTDATTMSLLLLPLILAITPLYNRFIGIRGRLELDSRARFRYGGPYENFFTEAMLHGEPVLITLKSRKVYIGLVLRVQQTVPGQPSDVTLLPSFSGYREPGRLTLHITQDYRPFLDIIRGYYDVEPGQPVRAEKNGREVTVDYDTAEFMSESFGVVLPLAEIESAAVWIPQIHALTTDSLETVAAR